LGGVVSLAEVFSYVGLALFFVGIRGFVPIGRMFDVFQMFLEAGSDVV